MRCLRQHAERMLFAFQPLAGRLLELSLMPSILAGRIVRQAVALAFFPVPEFYWSAMLQG